MKTFKEEILALIAEAYPAKNTKERDVSIAMRLFGWDGQGGCSLQKAGDEHGLTRERVRQITNSFIRNLEPLATSHLKTLPLLMEEVNRMAPASAERIEAHLSNMGLGTDRIEGVIKAATLFGSSRKHFRVIEEAGHRYVILPDMEGTATKIIANAQKTCGHLGMVHLEDMLPLLPGIPSESGINYLRDVLSTRDDAEWLDIERTWIWLRESPINRLITCLHKMLSVFSSTTVHSVIVGANRYYRKGSKTNKNKLNPPIDIMTSFINRWGEASASSSGIVRKTASFDSKASVLEFELLIVKAILSKPGKVAREKELENELVPVVDGITHPKKFNFSIHLNYSPLITKGEKRGEYITTGSI